MSPMKNMLSKNKNPLPPELERAASERFGKHVTREKAIVTLVFALLTAATPMLLGIRLWGRIPAIVTSTIGGSALSAQNYWFALAVFAGTFALSGLGLLVYNAICKRHNRRRSAEEN